MRNGFTLLELLTALSIAAIILMFAIPAQHAFLSQSKNQVFSTQLMRAINLARTEAMLRGAVVRLCGSSDLKACANDWQHGYIVFSKEEIFFTFRQSTARGKLSWKGFPLGKNYLEFLPSGLTNSDNGTFWYCVKDESHPSWAIMISKTGRARSVVPDKDGRIVNEKNEELRC